MNESGQGRLWGRDKKGKVREAKHQTINSCRALPREGRLGRGGIWQRRRLACLTAQSRGSVRSGEVVIKRGWPAEGGGGSLLQEGCLPTPTPPPRLHSPTLSSLLLFLSSPSLWVPPQPLLCLALRPFWSSLCGISVWTQPCNPSLASLLTQGGSRWVGRSCSVRAPMKHLDGIRKEVGDVAERR